MLRRLIIAFTICFLTLGGLTLRNRVEDLQWQLDQTNTKITHEVVERKRLEKKWQEHRDQFQQQMAQREQIEEQLLEQTCQLIAANDNLQQQITMNSIQSVPTWQLPNVISKVTPSVVYIEVEANEYGYETGWSGSGVIIGPHVVLTAGHVIEDVNSLTVTTVDGNDYTAIMWIRHPDVDYGFVFFNEELGPIAKFADSNKVEIGDEVILIGSPFGNTFFNTATTGIISGFNRNVPYFGEVPLITVDAAANPGNSGGPVFDMQGRIVGIVVGSIWGANDLSILVPANICGKFYETATEIKSQTD